MMAIDIFECANKVDLKRFVEFPYWLYRNNTYWVPPLKSDELKALFVRYNPAYDFCEAKWWLAVCEGEVVGRIGAIVNHAHIKKVGEKTGRFSRFECINDIRVAQTLLQTAENWLKSKGMTKVEGPLGFSNLDHQGLLVDGFDFIPSIGSQYHFSYYKSHLEKLGYQKAIDWLEFRIFVKSVPDKAKRVAEVVEKRFGFKVVHFNSKSQMKLYATDIFKLLNEAYKDLFAVVHLSNKMTEYYINRYMSLLNPRFVKVVENKNKELIGFIIAIPSLSRALQKSKGKLFPFGWYYLMKALKNPKEVDLLLAAVDPKKQHTGAASLLIHALQVEMHAQGVEAVETTGVFETNEKALKSWRAHDHIQHKRKRCWQKELV